jgi:hypothetical protein
VTAKRIWLVGLGGGLVVALPVTVFVTVWEWLENPGGIFRGPDGTRWAFVWETAASWLVPTFAYAALASLAAYLVWALALRLWDGR